ncbi:MAG: VCBS repeat-containing protein [Acidobacteria bacterium]|nr:VCBS repeat-containing protein [Acidobacteriota bacterium]
MSPTSKPLSIPALSLCGLGLLAAACASSPGPETKPEQPWERHAIDASSQGADGVRPADVNGDGLLDFATGWEEGGTVRAYLNPGPSDAPQRWPAVTVGQVGSPEDAVFADLDGDGAWDVISSTEGHTDALYVHWAPADPARYLDASAWTTAPIPASQGLTKWMFALPAQIDGQRGVDFFAGSKGSPAFIGWWQSPDDPRDLQAWTWRPLYQAGWMMSLIQHDVDGDGDPDLVASDRREGRRGLLWLENPGAAEAEGPWAEHRVGPVDRDEVMFMTIADLDQDGLDDMLAASKDGPLLFYRRLPGTAEWERHEIAMPASAGTGKAVAVADLDLDGRLDLAFTCEHAEDGKAGAMWLSFEESPFDPVWKEHPLSGPEGIKFDRIELLDLDADGDLDLITCEERDNLGVIWYENPTR